MWGGFRVGKFKRCSQLGVCWIQCSRSAFVLVGNSSSTSMNVIGSMIPVYTSRILRSTLLAACSDDIAAADDDDEEDDGHNDHNDQGPVAAASNDDDDDDDDENDRDSFVARETCVACVAASSRMTSPCSGRRLLALHQPKHATTVWMNPKKRTLQLGMPLYRPRAMRPVRNARAKRRLARFQHTVLQLHVLG